MEVRTPVLSEQKRAQFAAAMPYAVDAVIFTAEPFSSEFAEKNHRQQLIHDRLEAISDKKIRQRVMNLTEQVSVYAQAVRQVKSRGDLGNFDTNVAMMNGEKPIDPNNVPLILAQYVTNQFRLATDSLEAKALNYMIQGEIYAAALKAYTLSETGRGTADHAELFQEYTDKERVAKQHYALSTAINLVGNVAEKFREVPNLQDRLLMELNGDFVPPLSLRGRLVSRLLHRPISANGSGEAELALDLTELAIMEGRKTDEVIEAQQLLASLEQALKTGLVELDSSEVVRRKNVPVVDGRRGVVGSYATLTGTDKYTALVQLPGREVEELHITRTVQCANDVSKPDEVEIREDRARIQFPTGWRTVLTDRREAPRVITINGLTGEISASAYFEECADRESCVAFLRGYIGAIANN